MLVVSRVVSRTGVVPSTGVYQRAGSSSGTTVMLLNRNWFARERKAVAWLGQLARESLSTRSMTREAREDTRAGRDRASTGADPGTALLGTMQHAIERSFKRCLVDRFHKVLGETRLE